MAQARDAAAEARETGKQIMETVVDGHGRIDLPAPDVANSGIAADLDVPVHVAWSRVMGEVQWVGKGRSEGLKYAFRGIDAVKNAVGPAIRKHGVVVVPVRTMAEYNTVSRSGGGVMTYCRATVDYAIFGPKGDRFGGDDFVVQTMGEAFDTGDKASMKAQSVAERTFYITSLAIPTDQPAMDPEHGPQYELDGPKAPTAEEYAAEIQDESTSVNRLQQIKAELFADRRMGTTEVELFSGEKVRLVDLVQRVGRERVKK